MTYPLHLDLTGKRVVVVGAGRVAARRIATLLDAGADVTVIAPDATPAVADLADGRARDLAPPGLRPQRRRGAPGSSMPPPTCRPSTSWSSRRRSDVRSGPSAPTTPARPTPAPPRSPRSPVSWCRSPPATRGAAPSCATASAPRSSTAGWSPVRAAHGPQGSVVLIGGGPGDADLITVRGKRELLAADVVVYDRLAPTSLLELVAPDVELIDAGKSPGRHALTQDQINAVIVDRALAGHRVARLKGGDPFVLGRGSEEVLACAEAGVPVEVIPGISSSIAAPAAAGIPVTHRGLSTGFVVVSGHVVDDLSAVAATGLTVVVLMGVATLPRLVEEFVAAGRSAVDAGRGHPPRVRPGQRVVVGTLADIQQQVVARPSPTRRSSSSATSSASSRRSPPRCSRRDRRDPARARQPRPPFGRGHARPRGPARGTPVRDDRASRVPAARRADARAASRGPRCATASRRPIVVPAFLSNAFHVRVDVPQAVADAEAASGLRLAGHRPDRARRRPARRARPRACRTVLRCWPPPARPIARRSWRSSGSPPCGPIADGRRWRSPTRRRPSRTSRPRSPGSRRRPAGRR